MSAAVAETVDALGSGRRAHPSMLFAALDRRVPPHRRLALICEQHGHPLRRRRGLLHRNGRDTRRHLPSRGRRLRGARGPGGRLGRGLRPGRPRRPPPARRSGGSQRRVADPFPIRAPAARSGRGAARSLRPRRPDRLSHLAAQHRPHPGRAVGGRARRGGPADDRRRPAGRLRVPARGQRQPSRGGDRILARQPRRARPSHSPRTTRARLPGSGDLRPLWRSLDDGPARGSLPVDRGRGSRLLPRRQDRPRRRRASRFRAAAPRRRRSSLWSRPNGRATATCRWTS